MARPKVIQPQPALPEPPAPRTNAVQAVPAAKPAPAEPQHPLVARGAAKKAPRKPRGTGAGRYQRMEFEPIPYMQEYLDHLERQNYQPHYISEMRRGLTHFAHFMHETGRTMPPEELKRRDIIHYRAYLSTLKSRTGETYKRSYQLQLLKYLRQWIHWLLDEELIEATPFVNVKIGRIEKVPNPIEAEDIAQLFRAHARSAFNLDPFFFHRREVLLVLLFSWGLRLHEALALDVENMDARLDFVTVRNKGGGLKHMPYSSDMKAIVARYLVHRPRGAAIGESALFVESNTGMRMSPVAARSVIVNLGKTAGIEINPHRLRDTFGTTLVENGVPIHVIKELMGHSRLSQTLAYTRTPRVQLTEEHDRVMGPMVTGLLQPQQQSQQAQRRA